MQKVGEQFVHCSPLLIAMRQKASELLEYLTNRQDVENCLIGMPIPEVRILFNFETEQQLNIIN